MVRWKSFEHGDKRTVSHPFVEARDKEREEFEPPIPFGIDDFESRAFVRSAISASSVKYKQN